jgi:hypothetical protein
MLAAAGTQFGSSLFQILGAAFLAAFMQTTGKVAFPQPGFITMGD